MLNKEYANSLLFPDDTSMTCWVCGNSDFQFFKEGVSKVTAQDFKITDSNYGKTNELYRCKKCSFIQAVPVNALDYYEKLEDTGYIESSSQRTMQFRYLIKQLKNHLTQNTGVPSSCPRALDIGAGSGLFVKEAINMGFNAQGIEPSVWLSKQAQQQGIPVVTGTFPSPDCKGPYDVIFMIDVIEHLENPKALAQSLNRYLSQNGRIVVVTPNVSSFTSKLMGKKWWHYRIAHVGYYNKKTLAMLMEKADLVPEKYMFVKWYFTLGYITERLKEYISFAKHIKLPDKLQKITVACNFFDSMIVIFKKSTDM